jgi:hypothetical protein
MAVLRRDLIEAHAAEVAALRRELREAYEVIERLRAINTFIGYERMASDSVN